MRNYDFRKAVESFNNGNIMDEIFDKIIKECEKEPRTDIEKVIETVESLNSNEAIKEPDIRPGLIFDNLIIPENQQPPVNSEFVLSNYIDNNSIINKFPEMGKIQETVRSLGVDITMTELYNKFVIGETTNGKRIIVDISGLYMNELPKIVLWDIGVRPENCNIIHLNDIENLINYITDKVLVNRPESVVTNNQRIISSVIVNYGTQSVHKQDKNIFESLMIDKVVPFIKNNLCPKYPGITFRIDNYVAPGKWDLICDDKTPMMFGVNERLIPIHVLIHSEGLTKDDSLNLTVKEN